jgi:hypothetical protein
MRNVYKMLVGNPAGRRLLGRTNHRWEDNIKMNLGEVSWEDVDWIHLAQDKDQWWARVNTIMNLQVR